MGGQQSQAVADREAGAPSNGPATSAPAGGSSAQASSAASVGSVGMVTGPQRVATNKVQLAVSVLGGMPGATAYHSSVVINGEEYFFSDAGIQSTTGLQSHKIPQKPDSVPEVIDMGMSIYSGSQVKAQLSEHFKPGTYDLLRKNCNSFSDCALFLLVNKRVDSKYRALEKLGEKNMGLVQAASGGNYKPNPLTDGFDLEAIVANLDPEKVWKTPGQATGGAPAAASAADLRAARLARFGAPPASAAAGGGYSQGAQGASNGCHQVDAGGGCQQMPSGTAVGNDGI